MTREKSYGSWYFLAGVSIIYLILSFFQTEKIIDSISNTFNIIMKILPIFLIVLILMTITNYYLKPKFVLKHMGKDSGIKGWIISIIGGMLSTGPIYLWLPLLNDMQKKGVRNAHIATFLYNRAIKLALLPILVTYLGLIYTAVLTVIMIIASIIQGLLTEKFVEVNL